MSRYSISIGDKTFDSKSKAIIFYKNILNAYKVGEELSREDRNNIVDLFYMDFISEEIKAYGTEYDEEYDGEKINLSAIVICQDSCHVVQAAIFRLLSFCRTGLSQTVVGRSQLRVGPRQRSGRAALAAS